MDCLRNVGTSTGESLVRFVTRFYLVNVRRNFLCIPFYFIFDATLRLNLHFMFKKTKIVINILFKQVISYHMKELSTFDLEIIVEIPFVELKMSTRIKL